MKSKLFEVFYQIGGSWSLDRTKNQWVDLGVHNEACMTRSETSGVAGGAISLWVKRLDCQGLCGVISSLGYANSGSILFLYNDFLR